MQNVFRNDYITSFKKLYIQLNIGKYDNKDIYSKGQTFHLFINVKYQTGFGVRILKCCSTHLHDVEEDFLPQAVLAFEELVLRVGAGDVSADELLTGGGHLQQLRILVLHRHVGSVAQQLPYNGPEMMRDALPDQLLEGKHSE